MALAGKDALLQVNGTSGSWNELAVTVDASSTLEKELYDTTNFGDEGMAREAEGVLDSSVDVEIDREQSVSAGVEDIRDSILNGTEVQVEYSPDGNATGGPTDVFHFKAKCSSYEVGASTGSKQTISFTLEQSDGQKVTVDGSLS